MLGSIGNLVGAARTWAVRRRRRRKARRELARPSSGRLLLPHRLKEGGVGIELGVATGYYSDVLLSRGSLARLYSIDAWADGNHNDGEYVRCVERLSRHGQRSVVMRMRFAEALVHFPDEYFDFLYIDGYANTGQEDGTTLWNWWPKAKAGAIFAGHDYHPQWPETMAAVDRFCRKVDRPITVIEGCKDTKGEDRFDSWSIIK